MIFIDGECGRSVIGVIELYAARFPNKVTSSWASYFRVVKEFTENGYVLTKKRKRWAIITGQNNEIAMLKHQQ